VNHLFDRDTITNTTQLVLLKSQLDFYAKYESAIATTVSLGYSEEEAKEITDQAVKINADNIKEEFKAKGLYEQFRNRSTQTKGALDIILGGI